MLTRPAFKFKRIIHYILSINMAMVLPELYNKCNDITIVTTKDHIEKYSHLIEWKSNSSIMELGVGDGNCSISCLQPILPKNFKEFVAMDISEKMLKFAKNNINIPNCKFVQCDVGNEQLDDEFLERFDNIFSFYCIHMIHNTSQAIENIYKMLRPGGEIFLTIMEYSMADEAFDELNKQKRWEKLGNKKTISPFYHSKSPAEEYKKILSRAGFKSYTFQKELVDYDFCEEEVWKKFCISINPLLPKIPPEDVEDYKREYLQMLRKSSMYSFLHKNGIPIINVKYKMFIIVAKKTAL